MKTALIVFFLSLTAEAKLLEVPDNCFNKKSAPCLTQINENEETLSIGKTVFRISTNTILHWKNFSDISVDILKGAFHITENDKAIKLNEIPIAKKNQMLQKQENLILCLDLGSFILSTYDLSAQRANTVLLKTSFLEKSDFLKFTAQFFERKYAFIAFLKSIETPWKAEFSKILSQFLTKNIFPADIAATLSRSLHNPAASSCADEKLLRVLKNYDPAKEGHLMVEQLPDESLFFIKGDRVFKKGEKIRKRYKCMELSTGKWFLFSPVYEVVMVDVQ